MKHLLLFHFGECLPALPPVAVRICPFPLPSVYSMFQPVRLYSANSNEKKLTTTLQQVTECQQRFNPVT